MTNAFCFVHIGAPKTGSTFLQKVFYENRDNLAGHGMLYPDVSLRGFGHHDIAFSLSGGYPEWATPQPRSMEDLSRDLATACMEHVGSILLSSEIFYLSPEPDDLRHLLENTGLLRRREPRIIVYLRRQDDAHESWYNQRVKAQGETGRIDASVKRYHDLWDYERQLSSWAAAFGKQSLVVRRYPPPAAQTGSLLEDMLEILGIANIVRRPALVSTNVSENRDILDFQRQLNRLPLSPQEKRCFHKELMVLSEKAKGRGIFDERPLLGVEERRTIMASYAASNAAVARDYFSGAPLFPDVQRTDQEILTPVEEGLTDRKMIYILGWLLEYRQPN